MIELDESHVVGPGGAWLYESPLWDHRRQVMLWVDVDAGDVYEHDPSTDQTSRHHVADAVPCIALRAAGGYVLATRTPWPSRTRRSSGSRWWPSSPGCPRTRG